uniref:WD_REPEATS_REGION domain-containing protein n=1 Tax=Heterorhabditis bacteriophora TaxID=37862 RepID=A0A1I7XH82_HETBA
MNSNGTNVASSLRELPKYATLSYRSSCIFVANPLSVYAFDDTIINLPSLPYVGYVDCLRLSTDERNLAISCGDLIKLIDLSKGRELRNLTSHTLAVKALCPRKTSIYSWISGSLDSSWIQWDTRCHPANVLSARTMGPVRCVEISPDDIILAVGTDSALQLYDIRNRSCLAQFTTSSHGVSFHSAQRMIATYGLDKIVRFWCLDQLECVSQSDAFESEIRGVQFADCSLSSFMFKLLHIYIYTYIVCFRCFSLLIFSLYFFCFFIIVPFLLLFSIYFQTTKYPTISDPDLIVTRMIPVDPSSSRPPLPRYRAPSSSRAHAPSRNSLSKQHHTRKGSVPPIRTNDTDKRVEGFGRPRSPSEGSYPQSTSLPVKDRSFRGSASPNTSLVRLTERSRSPSEMSSTKSHGPLPPRSQEKRRGSIKENKVKEIKEEQRTKEDRRSKEDDNISLGKTSSNLRKKITLEEFFAKQTKEHHTFMMLSKKKELGIQQMTLAAQRGGMTTVARESQFADDNCTAVVLNIINERKRWDINVCCTYLPRVKELLNASSRSCRHTAVESLQCIATGLLDSIRKFALAPHNSIGVDVAAEERKMKAEQCLKVDQY